MPLDGCRKQLNYSEAMDEDLDRKEEETIYHDSVDAPEEGDTAIVRYDVADTKQQEEVQPAVPGSYLRRS